jgi:type III secretion system YscQ/HrcQ family protein
MPGASELLVQHSHEEPALSLAAALPSVDPAASTALNTWLRRRTAPIFSMNGSEYEIGWRAPEQLSWQVVAEIAAGAHRAWLALDGFAAIDPLMVGEPLSLMPAPLRGIVVQRLMAQALVDAPRALTNAADVRAIHWNAPLGDSGGCRLTFALTRRADGVQSLGALVFETPAALEWLDSVLPLDEASRRAHANMRVPLYLLLGRSVLTTGELSGLRAADVVWIESASIARDGVAVELGTAEQAGLWKCRARRHELRIVAAGAPTVANLGSATSGSTRATVAADGKEAQTMGADRWRLDVPVTFELATLSMKVDEVEQLQPGQVIELPQDLATASVTLRVAGAAVAEGSLIVVGKRLGVRIGRVLQLTG